MSLESWAPGPPSVFCFCFLPPSLLLGSAGPPTNREIKNAPPSRLALPRGWQHEPPKCGKELVGWRCKITYPSGKTNERKWQDGFVLESHGQVGERHHRPRVPHLRAGLLVDAGDEWVQDLPDDGICFRKPGLDETRASAEELRQAHRATSEV